MLNWEQVQRAGWWEASRQGTTLLPLPSPADTAVIATTMQLFVVPDCLPLFCPKAIRVGSWFGLLSADLNWGFGNPSNRVVIGSSPSPPQQSCWWMLHHFCWWMFHHTSPVLSCTAAGISAELLWVSGNHMLKCYPACLWGVSDQLENVNSVQTVTTESLLIWTGKFRVMCDASEQWSKKLAVCVLIITYAL